MGLEKHKTRRQFGPEDLGILDGPTPRGFRTIVELCSTAVDVPVSALFVFDDMASALFLRASTGLDQDVSGLLGLPLTGSIAAMVRTEARTARISDLGVPPHDTSIEFLRFRARSYLGSVVRGPAEEPIGVLAAMRPEKHFWTYREARLVEDMAYLLSQQIMLKASFATLRIMSAERQATGN